jgi:hypothetical protein
MMTDLSFLFRTSVHELDKGYEDGRTSYAKYIGMSELGHPCARYLWYMFRNYLPKPPVDGRTQRIFDTGHAQEQRIVQGLQRFALVGNTQSKVTACEGHLMGFSDFDILGIPENPTVVHQGEAKSMNDKQFTATKKHGVQKQQFKHFVQFQVYGYLRKLTKYFYIAINKNDEKAHIEIGDIDPSFAQAQLDRGSRIVQATEPPERIGSASSPDCMWCPAAGICHRGEPHDVNYRNDGSHKPEAGGKWGGEI